MEYRLIYIVLSFIAMLIREFTIDTPNSNLSIYMLRRPPELEIKLRKNSGNILNTSGYLNREFKKYLG